MIAYFLKFLFPIWIAFDLLFQGLNWAFGEWPNHLFSTLIMLPAVCMFFTSALFFTLQSQKNANIFQSLLWSIETGLFMGWVWVPVVMWITAKVMLVKDEGPLNWGKTEHLGIQDDIKLSRLEKLKRLLTRAAITK